ncbi:MAG: hypothetical protein JWO05_2851 [Gemmatimonadetes bacterium]|nr:hypothetical protein [Gemmatimonadota bacterium]
MPTSIPTELSLRIVEVDPDFLRIQVVVGDGEFAGAAVVYEAHDAFASLADALAGFPKGSADHREAVLGSFGPSTAGGAVRLQFRLVDRSGHAMLEADVEADPEVSRAPRTAAVAFPVLAAAVDAFVNELRLAAVAVGASAVLGAA